MNWRFGLLGGWVLATGAVLWLQRQEAAQLREAIAWQRKEAAGLPRLQIALRQLRANAIEPDELARWREARATAARLRSEIEALEQRQSASNRNVAPPSAGATNPSETSRPTVVEDWVRTEWLRDAGRDSAPAALETVLWAAAGGEVETLAAALAFEPASRTKADAMMALVPESLRASYPTPERLVAAMMTRDVPLGSAHIIDPKRDDALGRRLIVQVQDEKRKTKTAVLSLKQFDGGWRVMVPNEAIEKYSAMLREPDPAASAK